MRRTDVAMARPPTTRPWGNQLRTPRGPGKGIALAPARGGGRVAVAERGEPSAHDVRERRAASLAHGAQRLRPRAACVARVARHGDRRHGPGGGRTRPGGTAAARAARGLAPGATNAIT